MENLQHLPSPDDEALFESLLIAYDEALARGEQLPLDESRVPARLLPRLRAALACVSLLARGQKARESLPVTLPHSSGQPAQIALKATIGRFELLREIGRGGHGVVFLAVDPRLRRLVALKVPRPEVLMTPDLHRRFLREGQAASALSHPNLVPIYEVGEDGPLCYIAAGYCEGPSLAKWLNEQSSPLPWREAAELAAHIADATAHAHSRGIVHRDIKPANILLVPADAGSSGATPLFGRLVVPCLTDFGLARLIDGDDGDCTKSGAMLGTPSYMAPEQATGRNEEVGVASDVYALGAVLYEVLVGRPPYRGANDLETLQLVNAAQLTPPTALRRDLPRDLEAICLKALSPASADRYQNAADLARDIRRYLSGEPTIARPLGRCRKTARALRRHPLAGVLAAVTALFLATLAGGGWWYSRRLSESLEISRQAAKRRDELRYASALRSAWQAYNHDHAMQAREILEAMPRDRAGGERDFAFRLLSQLTRTDALLALRGHTGDVYHVAFSPDGRRLASGGQDHTVRLWDAAGGASLAVLAGHQDEVNCVAWSPDGKRLASGSDDGTVRLWDVLSRRAIKPTLAGDRGAIVSLLFTHDGAYLLSGDERGTVAFTETAHWQTIKTYDTQAGRVHGLALSRDGVWLAAATEQKGVLLWDLSRDSPPLTSPLLGSRARGVAFDRDRLLSCGHTWAYLWNWSSGQPPRLLSQQADHIDSVAACGGGWLAAIAGKDGMLRVLPTDKSATARTFSGHTERIWCVAVSPDGWRLATAGADDTIKLWSLSAGGSLVAIDHLAPLKDVAFLDDGRTVAATCDDGTVRRWSWLSLQSPSGQGNRGADDGTLLFPPTENYDAPKSGSGSVEPFWELAVAPRGNLAATRRFNTLGVELWTLPDGQPAGVLLAESASLGDCSEAIAFSPDGQALAEAVGSSVRIWNLKTLRIERTMTTSGSASAVDFSPDAGRMAVAIGERLELWNLADGSLLAGWQAHSSGINSVAFSPGGVGASAGRDRLVRLFNGTTGETLATFTAHADGVQSLAFSPDGELLASGGYDQAVKLWSLQSYDELATLEDAPGIIRGLAFNPAGTALAAAGATGDERGYLRLWSILPGTEPTNQRRSVTATNIARKPAPLDGEPASHSAMGTQLSDAPAKASRGVWTEQARLTAPGGLGGDRFGKSAAMSADGRTVIIGAFADDIDGHDDQGSAYIFTRPETTWVQQARLTAAGGTADDRFGISVALSDDGNTALIGAYLQGTDGLAGQGAAYVFTRSADLWTRQAQLRAKGATGDWFGFAVALSGDGNTALVGARRSDIGDNADQGAAIAFERTGTNWSRQGPPLRAAEGVAGDEFGFSVALNSDGTRALVGALAADFDGRADAGAAYLFARSAAGDPIWEQTATFKHDGEPGHHFGASVSLSGDGETALVNSRTTGYVLTSSDGWKPQAAINLGGRVALSRDGNVALIGMANDVVGSNRGQGSAYVYKRSGTAWRRQARLIASQGAPHEGFGDSVALNAAGDLAIVGGEYSESASIFALRFED